MSTYLTFKKYYDFFFFWIFVFLKNCFFCRKVTDFLKVSHKKSAIFVENLKQTWCGLFQKSRDERILVSGPGYRIRNLTGKWYPNRYPNPEIFFLVSKPVSESNLVLVSKPVSESEKKNFGIQTGIRIRNFFSWYPNRYPNPKVFFLVSKPVSGRIRILVSKCIHGYQYPLIPE